MNQSQQLFGIGLPTARKAQASFFSGLHYGANGMPVGAALAAFEVANADRGEKSSLLLGKTAGVMAYPVMAGVASAGLCLIPGIGPVAAGFMAAILAGYESDVLGNSLARKIRVFTDLNKNIRHLEMGGRYQDTELAQRQRFLAIQDMSASFIPGRRYLGQEALLMHR